MNEYAPYQQRVVIELDILQEKVMALHTFLGGEVFPTLPAREQELLTLQFSLMSSYGLVLHMRIENFNKEMS